MPSPGLWVNVTKVAGIQTDLIINELLRGTSAHEVMPANTLIVANSYLDIIEGQESEPHSGMWIEIARDPDCLICGERLKPGRAVCWRRRTKKNISLEDSSCFWINHRYRLRARGRLIGFDIR